MRWGLGPVFIYECLANARRWQTYALRSVGVASLLFAMATIASSDAATGASSWRAYANLGQSYFIAMIGVELTLVMLAAPAATAGAICLDRARGTLAHMFMTDLSDPEIVLGKLAARILPVLGLVACTWPVMSISSLLGGIDPVALTMAFAIIIAVAVLGCTIALALSVWASKSHEVILATYTVFILGLLAWPVWYFLATVGGIIALPPQWTLLANPFYVAFAPYAAPGTLGIFDYLLFFGVTLGASTLMALVAVWRTRPVACRGAIERSEGKRIGLIGRLTRWLPGPSLDRSPVLWREWHRARPSLWMTIVVALLMGTTGFLCITGAAAFWQYGADIQPRSFWEIAGIFSYVLHVIFGLLMLAAIAPTSMAEERQRGSLDILAATSLSTRAIVIGKWMGTYRLVLLMTIGPALLGLAMATARSKANFAIAPGFPPEFYRTLTRGARLYCVAMVIATILAQGALYTSLGVALAVWIKRQSRAIAMSVGAYVVIAAAWPFFVLLIFSPTTSQKLAALSPVLTCAISTESLTNRRYGNTGGLLASGTFWAVEAFVTAIALLWLTIRTFDNCFDRIADRPRRISSPAAALVILATLIGAGSLVGAIDYWIEGVNHGALSMNASIGITGYSLLITIGIVLAAVDATKSSPGNRNANSDQPPGVCASGTVMRLWWRSFRLVALLTMGPALLALALATAHKVVQYNPVFTKNPSGAQVVTSYVTADPNVPYAGEVRLRQRLMICTVFVLTILVHGGVAVSAGLALVAWKRWTRTAIAIALGLITLVLFAVPLALTIVIGRDAQEFATWSFIMASDSFLALLVTRTSFNVDAVVMSVMAWNGILALVAIGLIMLAVRSRQPELQTASTASPALEPNA